MILAGALAGPASSRSARHAVDPAYLVPATGDAILAAFTTTLTHLGGASVTRDGDALDVTPPANAPRICRGFSLPVAPGQASTVVVTASDSLASPTIDTDQLTFACTP